MIDKGQPASNQTALPILEEFDEMCEVREWIEDNPKAWSRYMSMSKGLSKYGDVPPGLVVELMRLLHKVSISSDWKPALARIAMEQDQSIHFRTKKSKFDAFTEAVL